MNEADKILKNGTEEMKKLLCKIIGHKKLKLGEENGPRTAWKCQRCGHYEPEHLTEADYQTWGRF